MKKILITLCLMLILMLIACTNGTTDIDVASSLSTENTITEITAEEKIEYPIVIKTTAKNIEATYRSEDIFCIFTGEKLGFLKEDGTEITSYIYGFAYLFNEGLACVMKDNKYGFIDREGTEIIPLLSDKATPFSEELAYFELDNIYDDINFFNNGFAIVRSGGNVGIIDKKGNKIIPTEYNWINIEKNYFATSKNDMITYFDFFGKKINSDEVIFSIVKTYDNYTIFINNAHYGVLDSNKNIILSPVYNYIKFIEGSDLFIIKLNDKYGIINDKGEIKGPLQYDNIHIPYRNEETAYAIIRNKAKKGILRLSDFAETIAPYYENIEIIDKNFVIVYLEEKYGTEVVPASYDYIFSHSNIYHSNTSALAHNYNSSIKDHIIVVDENEDIDLSDIILRNKIIPRIPLYHRTVKNNISHDKFSWIYISDTPAYINSINITKLFKIDNFMEPILYFYNTPVHATNWSASNSVLYSIENNQVKEIVRGYESSGTSKGNYMQLYVEVDTGKIILGTDGFFGGFGGHASARTFYHGYTEYLNIHWLHAETNHDDNYLLENVHLFYDADNNPLNKENILEVDYIQEYSINGKTVSIEDYFMEERKYRAIPMKLY